MMTMRSSSSLLRLAGESIAAGSKSMVVSMASSTPSSSASSGDVTAMTGRAEQHGHHVHVTPGPAHQIHVQPLALQAGVEGAPIAQLDGDLDAHIEEVLLQDLQGAR